MRGEGVTCAVWGARSGVGVSVGRSRGPIFKALKDEYSHHSCEPLRAFVTSSAKWDHEGFEILSGDECWGT